MDTLVEAQKRYLENHPDTLGAEWQAFHNLSALRETFGEVQMRQGEVEHLREISGKIDVGAFNAILKAVEKQHPPANDDDLQFDRAAREHYSFLNPSADLSKIVRVEGLTEEQWNRIVGDVDKGDYSACELKDCCDRISDIRDFLLRARVNGGLLPSDVAVFQQRLNSHEPVTMPTPNLDRVLEQLGVSWGTAAFTGPGSN